MARKARSDRKSNQVDRGPRLDAPRRFPRTARLNALLHEIVADYFELADDDDLGLLTVTGVEVDNDLNLAQVYVSILGLGDDAPSEEEDAEILEVLDKHRKPVQRQIASQAKLRKTPTVAFAFDPGVRAGSRVEEILRQIENPQD